MKGIWVPVITPFRKERIDWAFYEHHLNFLKKTSIKGIVIAGSTGEGIKLLRNELRELISFSHKLISDSGKKIIVGLSPASLFQAQDEIQSLSDLPVDAFLVLTPFYYPPSASQNEFVEFYLKLAEFSETPIIIYNMPKYTHFEIQPDVISALCHHPNLIGIKYSGNDPELLIKLKNISGDRFEVIAGNGTVFPGFFKKGGESAILAIANILPRECVEIYQNRNNIHRIDETIQLVTQSNSLIVGKYGVPGIKYILQMRYGLPVELRSPYPALSETALQELESWYSENNIKIQ